MSHPPQTWALSHLSQRVAALMHTSTANAPDSYPSVIILADEVVAEPIGSILIPPSRIGSAWGQPCQGLDGLLVCEQLSDQQAQRPVICAFRGEVFPHSICTRLEGLDVCHEQVCEALRGLQTGRLAGQRQAL